MTQALLRVRDLHVGYRGEQTEIAALRGVSFDLGRERLGVVGESGSGKSTAGRALMGLLPRHARLRATAMHLTDLDLRGLSQRGWRGVRGRRIAMILQDPRYALNPVMRVGAQIAEAHRTHGGRDAQRAALALLDQVHIRDPARVARLYPHEVSGGMGQRVMIAMMLAAKPEILIADEPTSALDVAVQRQVLSLIDEMVRSRGMGLLLISHNLRLVASFCDRVLVMYAGRVVETIAAGDLADARHPYTRGLLAALPDLGSRHRDLPLLHRDPAWLEA